MSETRRNLYRRWLAAQRYLRGGLRADMVAGLTVAVMGVPQAMAYALIAGLPPVWGLYTAIVSCAVAAILGSSRHLVLGPTNASCMVILSLTAHLPQKYDLSLLEIAAFLTFLTAIVQMAFAALRLGSIVRYVSNSVVVGFTAGAGILIAANQLPNILGLDLGDEHGERFYQVLIAAARHVGETNPYALCIGAVTAVIVLLAPKLHRRLPGALLGVAATTLLCTFAGWHEMQSAWRVEIIRDIEPIRGGLPGFHLPELVLRPNELLTRELLTGAVALALLGLVEASSIARSVAAQTGQRVNFTREFFAMGAANAAGSCFSCFTGSGSLTRTAINHRSGGQTRAAALFSAFWTALALVFFGPLANLVPKAALAGILIVVAYSMVDKHRLMLAWRTAHHPRIVLVVTFAAALVIPLEFAILVGVFLSLTLVLRTTGRVDLTQLVARADEGFDEVPFNRAAPSPVAVVNLAGDLYFAAADDLDHELLRCITPKTRVVVLRMKRLRAVGSTAMAMLEHFWGLLRRRGIRLVVCGIEDTLKDVMTGSGLRQRIGEQNIFYADNRLMRSTELALARAWSIVRSESNLRSLPRLEEVAGAPARAPAVRAADLMNTRCIRFGNRHQLREAIWLVAGLLEHSQSLKSEPLFLQDREGRLAGELTPRRLLHALTESLGADADLDLANPAVAERMRREFTTTIDGIARREIARVDEGASLARMLEGIVRGELQVLPVCDADGRLVGQVSAHRLVRELDHRLGERNREREEGAAP